MTFHIAITQGTEENHENLSQDSLCPGQDQSSVPPEYKLHALPLHQPTSFRTINYCLITVTSITPAPMIQPAKLGAVATCYCG
jgi:hypothetical protein